MHEYVCFPVVQWKQLLSHSLRKNRRWSQTHPSLQEQCRALSLEKKTKGNCQPIHYKTAAPAQNHANIERNELVLPAMIPAYTEACLCLYLTRSGARWNVGTPPLAGRWWTERIKSMASRSHFRPPPAAV